MQVLITYKQNNTHLFDFAYMVWMEVNSTSHNTVSSTCKGYCIYRQGTAAMDVPAAGTRTFTPRLKACRSPPSVASARRVPRDRLFPSLGSPCLFSAMLLWKHFPSDIPARHPWQPKIYPWWQLAAQMTVVLAITVTVQRWAVIGAARAVKDVDEIGTDLQYSAHQLGAS